MESLLREIERAVKARGWSARQASLRAVGTPELIREMRRGRVPSVERIRSLCEVLDREWGGGKLALEVGHAVDAGHRAGEDVRFAGLGYRLQW